MVYLPKRLRKASPEEVAAYRQAMARKAVQSCEDCRAMFRQRMQREGREAEFDALIAKYREEDKSRRQAVYAAMRDFGYRGADVERRLHKLALAKGMLDRRRQIQQRNERKYRERVKMKTVEEAILKLPARAPVEVEWNWVRNHLAMTRKKRQTDIAQRVEITVADIEEAGHGEAPSQAAATMLINYVNSPDEFFKLVMGEDKKGINATGPGASENKERVSDDLSGLKRIHAQFMAQQAAKQ